MFFSIRLPTCCLKIEFVIDLNSFRDVSPTTESE